MATLKLFLFGGFRTILADSPVTTFESSKVRALLIFLAVDSRRSHLRSSLAGLLWPDWPQKSAMSNLRYALADLRKNIGDQKAHPHFLLISRELIQLNLESDVWVDVVEFEQKALSPSSSNLSGQVSTFQDVQSAIDLYQGEFLDGFSLADSPDFEEWVLGRREHFRRQALQSLQSLSEIHGQRKEYKQALAYARKQLEIEPWQEAAHQQVMRLLALSGQRISALTQYETCQRLLSSELGVKPSTETTQLYEAIRDERIFHTHAEYTERVSKSTTSPRGSIDNLKHNLPEQLSSFIGREKEITEVQALLRDAPGRLVTLVGAGGVGKTRLALQASVGLLEHFPNGIWLVELASLAEPNRLPSAVAAALDVHESPGRPANIAVRDYLQAKHLLLILDNCEHLVDDCADLVYQLLQASPELHVLATSRERLGVQGETCFYVPSLSIPSDQEQPDHAAIYQYEASRLFVERAQSISPNFILSEGNALAVIQICQRLDGIPLAIELAAARSRLLSAGQIATHLDDVFHLLTGGSRTDLPRHQTLRALIDWSYNLLASEEQELLQWLSVFAGSWTLVAAESVCQAGNVLDLLGQLVDKSLVSTIPGRSSEGLRYRMLETIRQYASEKLVETRKLNFARDCHLTYYLSLAERIEPELRGRTQKTRLDQLEDELDNLRKAMRWALETNLETELRMASAMMWFWHIRDRTLEGLEWLEQGLTRSQVEGNPPISDYVRAKALAVVGAHLTMDGKLTDAEAVLEKSVRIYQELGAGEETGLAFTLRWYGQCEFHLGKISQAEAYCRQALALYRKTTELSMKGEYLSMLNMILEVRDPGSLEVRQLLLETLDLLIQMGDLDGIATTYRYLGWNAYNAHHLEQAKTWWEHSHSYYQQVGNQSAIVSSMIVLGNAAFMLGDFPMALEYQQNAVTIQREVGNPHALAEALGFLGGVTLFQGNYELSGNCLEEALALNQNTNDRVAITFNNLMLGRLAWAEGNRELAVRKLAEAFIAREDVNTPDQIGFLLFVPDLLAYLMFVQSILTQTTSDEKEAEAGLKTAVKNALTFQMEYQKRASLSLSLDGLAQLTALRQPERAARLFSAAEHLRWDTLFFMTPVERDRREAALAQVKTVLGEQRMAELWAEGQAMNPEQAVNYALEEEDPLLHDTEASISKE